MADIILYDLPSKDGRSWSENIWKGMLHTTRLMLYSHGPRDLAANCEQPVSLSTIRESLTGPSGWSILMSRLL